MHKFILIVPNYEDFKYTVNINYFKKLNTLPYYICDYNLAFKNIKNIAGILLTGGGDISQKYLKEPLDKTARRICQKRDDFEIALLKHAFLKNIPTLAICRGMQIMNIAFGGTIYQNIKNHMQKEDKSIKTHTVFINKNSNFFNIIQKNKIAVNSVHHQSINKIASYFKCNAIAKDKCIEGIEFINKKKYFLGLQWHPESLNDIYSQKIFKSFIKKALYK